MANRPDLGNCRFYEAKFPADEELVMVKVERIEDMGAYVSLLEYNNIEGMILMSELSKVRFRSVNRLIRVGRHEVVIVLRVDAEKGYIDLSKRRVSPEDIVKCEDRFSKSKKVQQTIRHVAQKYNMKVDYLNEKITWPLYKAYGHAYDALKEAVTNPDTVFAGMDITDEVKDCILTDIKLRLAPQAIKLRVKIDVLCFGYEGIGAVKDVLIKGKAFICDPEVVIDVKLIAPPQYMIVTTCYNKQTGINRTQEVLDFIRDEIKKYQGGEFKQQGAITVIREEEDRRLLMQPEEEYDEDVDDDGSESEDETMGRVRDTEEKDAHTYLVSVNENAEMP